MRNWCGNNKDRRIRSAAVGLAFVGGLILLATDFADTRREMDGLLYRNGPGAGSRTEELDVQLAGEQGRIPVEIELSEQRYSQEEIQGVFDRVIGQIEKKILGQNERLDRVEKDMNLLTEFPGEPVSIAWELDRYDVMNVRGEIQKNSLAEEGTLVGLRAVLTYREDEAQQALYQCTVCVYPEKMRQEEENTLRIKEEIQAQEKKSQTQKSMRLPERLLDREAVYYRKMDRRGVVLVVMAALAGILFYALELQNRGKEQEQKKQQMILDYPEVVDKMTLFLGAGMTVKWAWRKVVEDYVCHKEMWGERYVYEEMRRTCHEMESGITEAESYERFGRRCGVQIYIRLGALLSQNLRKGNRGLTELLRLESVQAFEERKARAKRLGEEAGTRLLLPMFLMLAVVLVIVIVPAFLSVQV